MGKSTVKIKLMPDSVEADTVGIGKQAESAVKERYPEADTRSTEEEIAFGLKAVILEFTWDDELDSDELEAGLGKIEHVNSVEVLDFQRAFG